MSQFMMTIEGRGFPGERGLEVVNPATGRAFARAPDASPAELDRAVAAAQRAFVDWSRDVDARRLALRRAAEVLMTSCEPLAELLSREQGKPLQAAAGEILGAVLGIQAAAELSLSTEIVQDDDALRVEVSRRPIGVVGAIAPWNFPLAIATWKIAPALLAGNTVVLKPSPYTPLATLRLAELWRDVFPPGVLNVVSGGNDLGAWLSAHPGVRKVSFTGSVATGKKVAEVAARDLKRVTLELGGNDPGIVLPDADVDALAQALFWGAFQNSGQLCVALKRLYVHASVAGRLVERLVDLARRTVVGDGLDPSTELGPLNNLPQLERVALLVESARSAGARVLTGGRRLDREGYFYPPTIVGGATDDLPLVAEEQFGPALPVLTFTEESDVIARANRGHFGLGASVWTRDVERGRAVASALDCGTVWINGHGSLIPTAPFGGAKWSGLGYENGPWGLAALTELKTLQIVKEA